MASTYDQDTTERVRELFVTGLKNAHALEKQALSIMEPQVARIENYPEVAERLRSHIEETHQQIARLDEIMERLDVSPSALKEAALSFTGGMAALGHSVAGDEILKNSFANHAFENFEIAAYRSLIVMAEDGGFRDAAPLLEQTLGEEKSMAEWIYDSLPVITRRYAGLSAQEGAFAART